jgi:DNA polymerase-3 subunit delta'
MSAFDPILGHERVLAPLRRALAEGRLHPSLLFHGPEGVGKRLAAFAIAAALNCTVRAGEGCGECSSCRRTLKGYGEDRLKSPDQNRAAAHHADVLYYAPRRRQIQIEQILDLCREAGFRPFEGKRRIFIIDPAERMNREAANALLKTLEEPPAGAVLILISSQPDALPATIRSRCQAIRFAPLPREELAALLTRQGRAEAERLAALADGSVGRALAIDLEAHDEGRARLVAFLEACGEPRGALAALGLAQEIGADAETFDRAADLLTSILRDLAVVAIGGPEARSLRHPDLGALLLRLAPRLAAEVPGTLDRIEEARRRVRGNVAPRLAAEAILAHLARSVPPNVG